MAAFRFLQAVALIWLACQGMAVIASGGRPLRWGRGSVGVENLVQAKPPLQDIVTWDDKSMFVRGERVMFFSGEFHPFRLPVPDLWLDVLQKIKSLGFNGVSFYVDWALHEGKPGNFTAEGVFAWEPFFEAATKAGIYLLARPGPYINAEVSGGGFPGWLQRVKGHLRTADQDYLNATELYARSIAKIIAKAQITNGGPVILFQPENEYTWGSRGFPVPDPVYFNYVMDQYKSEGIIVPFISNDAAANGNNAPGTPGAVDIYGHDGYPLGFDCANPNTWPADKLPTNWRITHEKQSPSTPYTIPEFQAGAFDPWGGPGFENCAGLLNHEFERVFYKNLYSFGSTILNLYMIFGGTNWGNLGHPGGYTSYDYGSVIAEDRLVHREKYSELKLEANFVMASPAYLEAEPRNLTVGVFTDTSDLAVTPVVTNSTNFYVIRHADYSSTASTPYKLKLSTSAGNFTIPQKNVSLTLNGRDSKMIVTDYPVGDFKLIYSTADIFTWKQYADKTVLVAYGGMNEEHELLFDTETTISNEDPNVRYKNGRGTTQINWKNAGKRSIVKVGGSLYVYLLDRNEAYNFWVLDASNSSIIAKAGYLLRIAQIEGTTLSLTGDVNATTEVEVIGMPPTTLSELKFNGKTLDFSQSSSGVITATVGFSKPSFTLPDLSALEWKYIDGLPEIQPGYSDAAWTVAETPYSNNTLRNLTTPTSLYSSDYGFHTGTLIYRGQFTANGAETGFNITTQGGSAYGASIWINGTFIGSFVGRDSADTDATIFTIPIKPISGAHYVFTVVIDTMGLDENWTVGQDGTKTPRGILNYILAGHANSSDITWKLTGNFGGEDYADFDRGPLNEGGMYPERQGFHLPSPPSADWKKSAGPTEGIPNAGIAFYTTSFTLDLPAGYDIPLSFVFKNGTAATAPNLITNNSPTTPLRATAPAYRCQLFVNGYQFGKYVNNIGPQTRFPVPEGILDYHGENWVAVSLWALEEGGARVEGLELVAGMVVEGGVGEVGLSPRGAWREREGVY
ncbi:glycoside hydrolase family 35 protein [Aulographum hederae CBS 113979]|uniref:Beta-galactosidase n=1 Tax=Aulographum hederae CBS 113979 TaxID=1176131 RepID=A0A6G1H8G7_9PEZI|nr:glycoside hydrolase family 35 protein [Aulographum hederae CBS 113979]